MRSSTPPLFSASILLFFMFLSAIAFPDNSKTYKEKIYIHFDKTVYNSGENIWYKIYLVDAINHTPKTLSSVVYVDLIDPNNTIIDHQTIKVNEGFGHGDFSLPSSLFKGKYMIRAYTNVMRNFDSDHFFKKTILIDSTIQKEVVNNSGKDKINISFFPEGGHLVSGLVNNIGFKAANKSGKGVSITGSILDETGKTIRDFKASEFGQGMFQFIPEKGKTYKATVLFKGEQYTYELPEIKDHGVLMRVNEYNDFFRINMYSSWPKTNNTLKLIGLQKGNIVCQTELSGNKSQIAINVPKSDLNPGLVEFKLLDQNNTVLSKELAFSDSNNLKQNPTIKTSKDAYNKNETVGVEISLSEIMRKNEVANMSVSVTEVSPYESTSYGSDIKSHLFLTSELSADIDQPAYYLYSDDSRRKKDLNLLLKSQDINQDLFRGSKDSSTLTFSPESGFNLKGTVKDDKSKPVKAIVVMSYKNSKELGYDQTITDNLGRFNFDGLDFEERTFISLKTKSLKSKKYGRDFTIEIDSIKPPLYTNGNAHLESKIKHHRNTEFAPQEGEVKLDQVQLSAIKNQEDRFSKKRKQSLYGQASHTLDFKNLRNSPSASNPIQALQGLFPGVQIIGDNVTLRGFNSLRNNEPLVLIDGLPSDIDMVLSMSIFDIDFIDIVQGARAAIYGLRAGNGIIAVYTLDGSEGEGERNNRNGTASFYHPGYSQAREFHQNKENPSTLYWNPDLKLEDSDHTKIAFNTANKSGRYKVLLEGITSDGTPFKAETSFEVN